MHRSPLLSDNSGWVLVKPKNMVGRKDSLFGKDSENGYRVGTILRDMYREMCLKQYARIRNSRGDETRLTRNSHPRPVFSVGEPPSLSLSPSGLRAPSHRHALTQPTPNPYEGSFNSNLPFRDCSESCIFLSRTNVYHSITNRETFVPRVPSHLPPCSPRGSAPVSSDISFGRDIFLQGREPHRFNAYHVHYDGTSAFSPIVYV